MKERLRKEILELSVYYSSNPRTGRIELVVAGAGNGAAETKAALGVDAPRDDRAGLARREPAAAARPRSISS